MLRLVTLAILVLGLHVVQTSAAAGTCLDLQPPNPETGQIPSRCWGILGPIGVPYPAPFHVGKYGDGAVATAKISVKNSSWPIGYPSTCRSDMESAVATLDYMVDWLSADCHQALTSFFCRRFFPPCGWNDTYNGHFDQEPFLTYTFQGSSAAAAASAPKLNYLANPDLAPPPYLCDLVIDKCPITSSYPLQRFDIIKNFLQSVWAGTPLGTAEFYKYFNFNESASVVPATGTNHSLNPYYPCFGGKNDNRFSVFGGLNTARGATGLSARAPLCANYTGTVCKGQFEYEVYTPQYAITAPPFQTTQTAVESQLAKANFLFYLLPQPYGRLDYVKLVCAAAFPPCHRILIPTNPAAPTSPPFFTIRAPKLAQRALCNAAWDTCRTPAQKAANEPGPFLGTTNPLAAGLGFYSCSSQIGSRDVKVDTSQELCSNETFRDRFPDGSSYVAVTLTTTNGPLPVSVPTNAMASTTLASVKSVIPSCPAPLKDTIDPEVGLSGGSCALPCPSIIFTDDEYQKVGELYLTFLITGACCTGLLLFTYMAFAKTRKRVYTVYFTIVIFMMSLFLSFAPLAGNKGAEGGKTPGIFPKYMCIDDTHPSKNGYCVWVSTVMIFAGSSAVAWWCIQAVDLWLQITFNARRWAPDKQQLKELAYYSWAWGYPFLCLLIANSLNAIGNGWVGIGWCFFDDSDLGDDLGWGLFYGPVGCQCVIGAVLMGSIIFQLWKSSVSMKRHTKKGWWKLYVKPLLFILILEIVWIIIFIFRFDAYLRNTELEKEGEAYALWKLVDIPTAAASGLPEPADPGRPTIDRGMWYAIHVAVGGVGVWTFIMYYTEENFVMWYHWLTCKPYNFSRTSAGSTSGSSKTRDASGGLSRQGSKRVLYTGGAKKRQGTAGSEAASSTQNLSYGSKEKAGTEMATVNPDTVEVTEEHPVGGGLEQMKGDLPAQLEVTYGGGNVDPQSEDEAI